MSEEEIKKRLAQQRFAEAQGAYAQMQHQAEAQTAIKALMLRVLDEGARQRLNNIRTVNAELAMSIEAYIAQAYSQGQLRQRLTEADIVSILQVLQKKNDFRIQRK